MRESFRLLLQNPGLMPSIYRRFLVFLLALGSTCTRVQGHPFASDTARNSAQTDTLENGPDGYWGLSATGQYGFILIHSRDVRSVEDSYPWGIQVDGFWHWNRLSTYRQCRCYPKVGFSLKRFDYDNPSVLGNGYVLSSFLEPVYGADRQFPFSVRGAVGLAYGTNPHDSITNFENQSYSTALSFFLHVSANLHYRLSSRWTATLSANYNHVSNGGIRKPNKGINFPTLSLGVTRYFQPPRFRYRKLPEFNQKRAARWNEVYTFVSRRRIGPTNDQSHLVTGITGRRQWQVSRSNALGVGGELSYDQALEPLSKARETESTHNGMQAGLTAGHNFLMGRFSFSQYMGIYLYDPVRLKQLLFQRYALIYRINQRLLVGLALKAHAQEASFLDARLGWRF